MHSGSCIAPLVFAMTTCREWIGLDWLVMLHRHLVGSLLIVTVSCTSYPIGIAWYYHHLLLMPLEAAAGARMCLLSAAECVSAVRCKDRFLEAPDQRYDVHKCANMESIWWECVCTAIYPVHAKAINNQLFAHHWSFGET